MEQLLNLTIAYVLVVFILLLGIVSFFCKKDRIEKLLGFLMAFAGLYIGLLAFNKVYGLGDAWLAYSIADRSIAWETKVETTQGRIVQRQVLGTATSGSCLMRVTILAPQMKQMNYSTKALKLRGSI